MKIKNLLFSLVLTIFFIPLIKADEPTADHVRVAYDAYVSKFKKTDIQKALP